jgi:hypothetical protein
MDSRTVSLSTVSLYSVTAIRRGHMLGPQRTHCQSREPAPAPASREQAAAAGWTRCTRRSAGRLAARGSAEQRRALCSGLRRRGASGFLSPSCRLRRLAACSDCTALRLRAGFPLLGCFQHRPPASISATPSDCQRRRRFAETAPSNFQRLRHSDLVAYSDYAAL